MTALAGTLKLAWRNIWRSRRRTLISMSAVAIGLILVLVYGSVLKQMLSDAKEQLDNTGMGHVEITAKDWRARRPIKDVIADPAALRATLALPPGAEVSARLLSRGLLSSARGNEAVEVHGVRWQDEVNVASYLRNVTQGALPADDDVQGIVIGDELAARMKVSVGQKLRLMAQRADGEMGAQLFRVRGVYHAMSAKISERRVIVGTAAFRELVGVDGAHQIVIQLDEANDAAPFAARAKEALAQSGAGAGAGAGADAGTGASAGAAGAPGVDVMTYFEIFPMYAQMEALMDSVTIIMSIFVYFLVGLGILNTMLMSVLERTREIGVMQALGTRPSGIVALILAESFWIATLSVVIGVVIGMGVNFVGESGLLDYSKSMGEAIDFGGVAMSSKFRTDASLREALGPALFVYIMALFVGLYPAWRITRMRVVDAVRAK